MLKRLIFLSLSASLAFTGLSTIASQTSMSPIQKLQGLTIKCPSGAYTSTATPTSSGGVTSATFTANNHNTTNTDITCIQKEVAKKLKISVTNQVVCKPDNAVGKGAVVCKFPTNSVPKR